MTSARKLAKLIEEALDDVADARRTNDTEWLRRAEGRLAELLDERARGSR
jgi:hypothetical protein